MPIETWTKLDTDYGPVEYMVTYTEWPDYIWVRVGERSISAPAAAKIVQNYTVEGAAKALAKELYAVINN